MKFHVGQTVIINFPKTIILNDYYDDVYIINGMTKRNGERDKIRSSCSTLYPCYKLSDGYLYPESCLIPCCTKFK